MKSTEKSPVKSMPVRDRAVALDDAAVTACPATRYLKRRGLDRIPLTGLSALAGEDAGDVRDGQSAVRAGLPGTHLDALVVWAYDSTGTVTGGQRILLHSDGSKADTEIRKPSFGQIAGSVARFPARSETEPGGPLIIAEGPESALSIWQATGCETWAVFGVSGWRQAPLPMDRAVILAPDRDAPSSPAGRAFRKALAYHVGRGCRIKVAVAPETVGSKKDLNDTHRRAGERAVRDAIDAARTVTPWLSRDLNAGQRAAAEAMLGPDRLTLVTGHAGSGKTFTLAEVARVWQERGVEVLAGAPSGKATQELSRLAGVQVATLAAWESRWARGETPRSALEENPFVFLMDEAGMVGSRQWARLQSRIGAMGGKLVAIGDPEQLQPVKEISGWNRAERAVRKTGGTLPVIDVVQRQLAWEDQQATRALARGDRASVAAALQHYDAKGAIRFGMEDPVAAIAKAFVEPFGEGARESRGVEMGWGAGRIALAATNKDVARLNAAIRVEAVRQGLVQEAGMQEFPVEWIDRTVDSDGMEVVERHEALVAVGVGDRMMLTQPHVEAGLPRSSFGTVTDVDPGGFWLDVDGRDRPAYIDAVGYPQFAYGYAATVHKSQGMTVEDAFVLLHRSMDRYAVNVALTRHRQSVTLYGQSDQCASLEELTRLSMRRERPFRDLPPVTDLSMVPLPDRESVLSRADWIGSGHTSFDRSGAGGAGGAGSGSGRVSLLADRQMMAVATRVAGLLSADFADADPLLVEMDRERSDKEPDYTRDPARVIDDLVARHGVIYAEEIAGALARQVRDPETFLRLFRETLDHDGLVRLPREVGSAGGRPGAAEQRVFTTASHLSAEMAAVDRGLRMAVRGRDVATQRTLPFDPDPGEFGDPVTQLSGGDVAENRESVENRGFSAAQQQALRTLVDRVAREGRRDGGTLDIVVGGTGSGKTRLAARLRQALQQEGPGGHGRRRVVVVSPTEAGRNALRAEGVEARTLGQYLSEQVETRTEQATPTVVIVDDAQGLGIGQADSLLARVDVEGSRLVVLLHPERRPARAGPVFQRLAERLRTYQNLEGDVVAFEPVLDLHGTFGVTTPLLQDLGAWLARAQGPQASGAAGRSPDDLPLFDAAVAAGVCVAGGSRDASITRVAQDYVADPAADRLALAWSRREVDALTVAIRAELDATRSDRASVSCPEQGPCTGLKPGDRIRFLRSGVVGTVDREDEREDIRIRRGDTGVVTALDEGSVQMTLNGVGASESRAVRIPFDGPLPDWSFAFASTIQVSTGRRHARVHLLASSSMDRTILSMGVAVATRSLTMTVPVTGDQLATTLDAIDQRTRCARSVLDHGFDPVATMRMARDTVALGESPVRDGMRSVDTATQIQMTRMTEVSGSRTAMPKVRFDDLQLRRANRIYLEAHPEQVVALLAVNQAVFTESEIRTTLRAKTGYALSDRDVVRLTRQVVQSPNVVRLTRRAPDGDRQYITGVRATHLKDLGADADHLATERFAPGDETGDGSVLRPKILDELNAAQALAAEAMLDARRLTMVTGRAGTGKTFTLKAVASEWRARDVKVLAGAPSGKATAELKGLRGVRAETLATWEARWARGEVPTEPFVFIMDEAGMVGAGQWARIQAKVRALGGKLIAVGDPDQLQPISDLPAWGLAERAAGGSVVLDSVVRQRNLHHRRATEQLARAAHITK